MDSTSRLSELGRHVAELEERRLAEQRVPPLEPELQRLRAEVQARRVPQRPRRTWLLAPAAAAAALLLWALWPGTQPPLSFRVGGAQGLSRRLGSGADGAVHARRFFGGNAAHRRIQGEGPCCCGDRTWRADLLGARSVACGSCAPAGREVVRPRGTPSKYA